MQATQKINDFFRQEGIVKILGSILKSKDIISEPFDNWKGLFNGKINQGVEGFYISQYEYNMHEKNIEKNMQSLSQKIDNFINNHNMSRKDFLKNTTEFIQDIVDRNKLHPDHATRCLKVLRRYTPQIVEFAPKGTEATSRFSLKELNENNVNPSKSILKKVLKTSEKDRAKLYKFCTNYFKKLTKKYDKLKSLSQDTKNTIINTVINQHYGELNSKFNKKELREYIKHEIDQNLTTFQDNAPRL